MPDTVPVVTCCVCSRAWLATDPRVLYRSLDRRWACSDETGCNQIADMWAALASVWAHLEANGWRI